MVLGIGRRGGNVSAPSPFEEGGIEYHTPQLPYCSKLGCWCRTNVEYHKQVTGAPTTLEYYAGEASGFLSSEFDDEQYEYALSLLGAR